MQKKKSTAKHFGERIPKILKKYQKRRINGATTNEGRVPIWTPFQKADGLNHPKNHYLNVILPIRV